MCAIGVLSPDWHTLLLTYAPQVASLRTWLKAQPASRRPLVKMTARIAPEATVKMLQASITSSHYSHAVLHITACFRCARLMTRAVLHPQTHVLR